MGVRAEGRDSANLFIYFCVCLDFFSSFLSSTTAFRILMFFLILNLIYICKFYHASYSYSV